MHPDLENLAQRLRDLPVDSAPPYDWAEFKRRAALKSARSAGAGRRYALAATGFVLIVAAIALWSRYLPFEEPREQQASAQHHDDLDNMARRSADSLMAQEQFAMRVLESLPPEPVIAHVGTRLSVTKLEDRIAWFDDLITAQRADGMQPAQLHALEQERARLVSALAQVRYAESLAAGLH